MLITMVRFFSQQFQTKDLGKFEVFSKYCTSKFQKTLIFVTTKIHLAKEVENDRAKPTDTTTDSSLIDYYGNLFKHPDRYRRLIGKLNYLGMTCPNVTFLVTMVSQFMPPSRGTSLTVIVRMLSQLKKAPGRGYHDTRHIQLERFSDDDWSEVYVDNVHIRVERFSNADGTESTLDRKFTTGYCVFLGGHLVPWKTKK